jgi:hypothetical protein
MKILHICLSCFYIDNFSYQENVLPRQNKLDGHEVQILASTETYGKDKKLQYLEPGKYINEDSIKVIRLPYRQLFFHSIMKKVRLHPGVYTAISDFGPDAILFHGLCSGELLTVAKYKKNNPDVKFFADSHADANNSARSFLSKEILHRLYYGRIIRMALPYIDKILCVSLETKDFIKEMYDVPDQLSEFYPLGGTVISDDEYYGIRVRTRAKLGLSDDDVLIVQAGKLEKRKKVIESLQAFNGLELSKMRLVLIGSVNDEIKNEFESLVAANDSVSYLGWLDSPDLMSHLCAADLYLQPGSQSAIMQNSLCLRCPVAIADVPSHKPFLQGNGWAINGSQSISAVFDDVASNKGQLIPMAARSLEIARIMLDYRQLAARLYV